MIKQTNQPLNKILYGPPGTGKTYNTVIEAMKIFKNDPNLEVNTPEEYSKLKCEFDKLKNANQIEFVTFHQSYSYEEFVEGIRPILNSKDVKYDLHKGIFKQICNNASCDFNQVFEKFKEQYPIENELKTADHNNSFFIEEYCKDCIKIKNQKEFIHYKDLEKVYNDDLSCNFESRKEIEDEYASINDTSVLSEIYAILLILRKIRADKNKKYVLIIDEINRGNISKIFGELITLIEENKRTGDDQPEALEVTLPYSKEKFGVPKNLYIIGTMNTSDRSIAAIDIALRRRFDFVELMPKSNKVIESLEFGDIKLNFKKLFENINEKISVLLDRDHQIGHSYFIKDKFENKSPEEQLMLLKNIWFDKILPLLNEYFYGEWEKLEAILGPFIVKKAIPDSLKNLYDEEFSFDFVSQNIDAKTFFNHLKALEDNSQQLKATVI